VKANWKTTLCGILIAACQAAKPAVPPQYQALLDVGSAGAASLGLILAQDSNKPKQ
jgi:hypothetical protein